MDRRLFHLPSLLAGICFAVSIVACGGGSDSPGDNGTTTPNSSLIPLQYPPLDLSKVEFILPLGGMIGNHVTPIDHQYYVAPDFSTTQTMQIDVYAVADGRVTSIQHMGNFNNDDYRFVVEHDSDLSSIYIHVDNLAPALAAYAPANGQYSNTQIPVQAGDVLGNYTGSVDFNLVDNAITLSGFINPQSYTVEPWKIHTPDPFPYFKDSIRTTLLAKSLRTAIPEGGKIDHDISGRLVGNWFLENTNGYAGAGGSDYWVGHLAFAYDYIVPTHVIASFGDYAGQERQFGVVGNGPDPAQVSVASGMVKYELVDYDYYVGTTRWDRFTHAQGMTMANYSSVHGVVLVQLLADDRLKVEIFNGQTAASVNDFSVNAIYYVR